ncbi:MAG: tetratricopeptide repeat protein [Phaeodactylibacter sp.]|nr:tetratricopeptide repeat protein [Phaeodactylibacter sp.]
MKHLNYLTTVVLISGFSLALSAQESAASLYNTGLEQIKAKNYAEALPLMEQAIEAADPEADAEVVKLAKRNGAIAAYYVGNDQRKSDEFEAALATYDKGIAFSPGFYANYIGRAQALEGLDQAAKSVSAYIDAGDVCLKSKKEDKAEKMYSKAENIVAIAWGDKKWEATIEYATAFLEKRESPEAHYYLAHALKEKGNAEKAVEHADKAIELAGEGDASKYYMAKAESLEALGQAEAAVEAYKMVKDAKYNERAKYKINELSGGK